MQLQTIDTDLPDELKEEVLAFYKSCGRNATLETTDRLVLARDQDQIIGAVRLCYEEGCWVLRTMQVAKVFQGKGLGLKMLGHFLALVEKKSINPVYCLAYGHLELFYGNIGFVAQPEDEAPIHLRKRAQASLKKNPHQSLVFLKRDER